MLYTSGIVDDVTSSHNGRMARILYSYVNPITITAEIPAKCCSTLKTGSTQCEFGTGVKSAVYDCLVVQSYKK